MRIGQGYDAHKLISRMEFIRHYPSKNSDCLILGGVTIPHDKLLAGHSDADVLVHAIVDALLGAAALGDIGMHFPDNDPANAGVSSLVFLEYVRELLKHHGYKIENIDSTIIAQKPKLRLYIDAMRANIAQALEIDIGQVSVKATTTEGLGFTGREEGIAAEAVALLL